MLSAPDRSERVGELAILLGASPVSLSATGTVYDPTETPKGAEGVAPGCWITPERDGLGKVIGFNRRFRDGSKRQAAGTHRGLTFARLAGDRVPPLVISPEGASDVAALLTMGIYAVGRPSADGGTALLADWAIPHLPKLRRAEMELVILGENDKGAGQAGAEKVAGALAATLKAPVCYALPPAGVKDARQWLNAQLADLSDLSVMAEAGKRFLAGLDYSDRTGDGPGVSFQRSNEGTCSIYGITNIEQVPPFECLSDETRPSVPLELRTPPERRRCGVSSLLCKKADDRQGLGIDLACKRWGCDTCCEIRRIELAAHYVPLIRGESGGVNVAWVPDADVAKFRKRLEKTGQAGQYVSFTTNPGDDTLFVLAKPVGSSTPSRPATADVAADLIRNTLLGIDCVRHRDAGPEFIRGCRVASAGAAWRPNKLSSGKKYRRAADGRCVRVGELCFGLADARFPAEGGESIVDRSESVVDAITFQIPESIPADLIQAVYAALAAGKPVPKPSPNPTPPAPALPSDSGLFPDPAGDGSDAIAPLR